MKEEQSNKLIKTAIIVSVIIAILVVVGTLWMGRSAKQATEEAVHSVSRFYLDELATRREQVVATHLSNSKNHLDAAIHIMTEEEMDTVDHFRAFQKRMKALYDLEKFAFVDEKGTIYTSLGIRNDIEKYGFDYKTIEEAEISVIEEYDKDKGKKAKKVIIAVPVPEDKKVSIAGTPLKVCFMEIDMEEMLQELSIPIQSKDSDVTYCNIYTREGNALTDMILGGLASEDNLLDALKIAKFQGDASQAQVSEDFDRQKSGVVTFTYNGVQETLDYVPVEGTDWMLTYLIRESVISDRIGGISNKVMMRSLIQTILTALVMLAIFLLMMTQLRRNAKLAMEKEAFEAESRVKQEEMQQRLELQEKLLEQEKKRAEQDKMITAMASDYRSVYYIDLDEDEGICYRSDPDIEDVGTDGNKFPFHKAFAEYADKYVAEGYKEDFLSFIDIGNIRAALENSSIIAHRYLTVRDGVESYEMLRMAGVRHPKDRDDHIVHALGAGFTDVDSEMREDMSKNQALSDALDLAEEANKAKTAFLSNMSHEIRTPMNAIIGLDTIALSDPEISDQTRNYLQKIDGSAHHLLHLINDILDVSRIESGRMVIKNEEFSFSQLIEQINTMISGQCTDKGLNYECHVNGHLSDCYIGDDMKLKQVLINILGNAVKFTPEGGEVSFTVERTAHFDNKSTIRFTMADTGIGMDEEFMPKIFEAFSQEDETAANRYGSTGLGMAITKSIVEMMNGNIDVQSEKGKGTTFTVTVTLTDCEYAGTSSEEELDPQSISVLVIDDDPVACEHAKLVLEGVGISTDTAMDGEKGVEMVKVRAGRREPYNLILVDWKMPDMDGVETTRQIRSIVGSESAIIILTAYNWDDVLDEAVSAGVDSFLSKPLFAGSVLEEFKAALKKKEYKYPNKGHKAELNGRHILLAEDMMVNAEILKELLSMKGITADHAENGKIAVDMFTSHPEGYYDAILMDMRMPEMNGLDATVAIRASGRADAKEIPIIALTANAFDEDVEKSLQAGLNAHLSKPIEPDSLFSALEGLIKD